MTIKSQRLLARAKKIANKGEIEEARKLYTLVLEASPNNQEAAANVPLETILQN